MKKHHIGIFLLLGKSEKLFSTILGRKLYEMIVSSILAFIPLFLEYREICVLKKALNNDNDDDSTVHFA